MAVVDRFESGWSLMLCFLSGHLPWFEKALMTVHYVVMRDQYTAWDMPNVATQTSVALLRFCDVIPPDKAFYLAGMACRDNKEYESMAFVLLNHYLGRLIGFLFVQIVFCTLFLQIVVADCFCIRLDLIDF